MALAQEFLANQVRIERKRRDLVTFRQRDGNSLRTRAPQGRSDPGE